MASILVPLTAASLLAFLPAAMAGFSPDSSSNVAVYWGQNSYGKGSGPLVQERLAHYCENPNIDIIPIAFMNGISPPITNFANAGDNCTAFPDNGNVLSCPQIEEDIKLCQSKYNKTILLSLGGATYTQGGWPSPDAAESAAQMVWDMFGPVPSWYSNSSSSSSSSWNSSSSSSSASASASAKVDRPFGTAVIDGFDFDFESTANNLAVFGAKLRSLMDSAGGVGVVGDGAKAKASASASKKFLLSAAPQCVFPDSADGAVLDAVAFDLVMIQFYNNWCGVSNFKQQDDATSASASTSTINRNQNTTTTTTITSVKQNAFNFDVWDNWARNSHNPSVRMLLGIPAAPGAGGGYTDGDKLRDAILYSRQYPSFGGVMLWDLSQLYANTGFLDQLVSDLHGTVPPPKHNTTDPSPPPTNPPPTNPPPTNPPGSGDGLDKYAQCGGKGYNGPTVCKAPYTCVKQGDWWWSCK